jgi:hypothetical protein
MKFKLPTSLQSRLFSAGAALLILMGLLWVLASILAAHEQARTPGGGDPGVAATWAAFGVPIGILEFAGLSCLILASIVSIFRSILPSKPR